MQACVPRRCAGPSPSNAAQPWRSLPKSKPQRRGSLHALAEVTQESFQAEVLQADVPVIVDFWASWCGPCKLIDVVLKNVVAENEGKVKVVKVEVDSNQDLVATYGVYGLPTLVLFNGGEAVEGSKREGALAQKGVMKWLESNGVTL